MSSWQTPKTNWGQPGQTVPGVDDFNRIEGNAQHLNDTLASHKATSATTSQKGHVQLSNSTSSTSTSLGATANAVKTVNDALTSHKNENASINAIGHVYAAEFTTTLSTSWSGSAAPYTKTVTVNGITSSHNPIIDITMSGTYSTDQQRSEQWGYIYRAVTGTNQITFYATEKPTVSLPIQIKVVR